MQQYQRYFADADRVLILLHNEPDPDALAAGPGAAQRAAAHADDGDHRRACRASPGPRTSAWPTCSTSRSRPITPDEFAGFDRIATVDVQPHYFGGLLPRVDLVVDHHPEQPGYTAVFKDIRSDYGSTCTILTEHLRAVDVNISERTATAMLYAIKSDTLFFARQTNRVDLEAFSFLYPLADPALIRKMEGAEITLERLEHVTRALATSRLRNQVFSAFLGETTREDFIPYTADFLLQVEDVKWTIVSGIVGGQLDRQRPQPRLLAQRRRVREGDVRRHRQRRRPPGDGQGGRARSSGSARSSAISPASASPPDRRAGRAFLRERPTRNSCTRGRPSGQKSLRTVTTDCRTRAGHAERLIQIRDQILGCLESDRQPHHAARDAGGGELLVGEAVLRRQHRQAAEALGAAEAGGALDDLEPIEDPAGARRSRRRRRSRPCRRSRASATARSRGPDATAGPG